VPDKEAGTNSDMDNETAGFKYSWNNAAIWCSFSDPFFKIMPFMDFRSNVPFKICLDTGSGIMEMSFISID
jgi:hypothetical protein